MASARHFFGAELRYWRNRRGLSLAQLGRAVYVSADLIGKVEKAQRWPRAALVDQFEAVLDAGATFEGSTRWHTTIGARPARGFASATSATTPCPPPSW